MRFAPPNPLRIADRSSGLNALSVRSHNERLVLSLLLQNETTTRLEIGERTGLSAQTVSVIVRSMEQEGLVIRGEAQRGRVGPPTTPLLLNPEGAYSVGVSIGYRTTHIVLVDFVGNVKYRKAVPHSVPGMFGDNASIAEEVRTAISSLSEERQVRIAGIGLGVPRQRMRKATTNFTIILKMRFNCLYSCKMTLRLPPAAKACSARRGVCRISCSFTSAQNCTAG